MSHFVSEGAKEDNAAESSDAWTKAKEAVEALKKPKQSALGSGLQDGGLSLYETLQANKEKKQAEFEESQRLRNQFQALNEDDANFLDSVLESDRAKEALTKKETAERLEAFRKQREAAESQVRDQPDEEAATTQVNAWTKKRRRKDPDTATSKLRKTSTSAPPGDMPMKPEPAPEDALVSEEATSVQKADKPLKAQSSSVCVKRDIGATGLGLGVYDSDDD